MTIVLVTGATDGIGKETARALARQGADVIVHGRTIDKAERAKIEIERATNKKLRAPVAADLASLDDVRALAASLDREGIDVDVLINNAGMYSQKRTVTADGRELTMAVNHDAPFLLTHLLLSKSASTGAQGMAAPGTRLKRVINVSSVAHGGGRIDLDDLDMERGFSAYRAYANSKLANVLFSVELARRRPDVQVNALHPGVVSTKLLRAGFDMDGPDSLADGAATSVYLALAADISASGKYFVNSREARPSPAAFDAELCAKFYEASRRRVGLPT